MKNDKKQVYLVHGWGGRPEGGWRPWLKRKLEDLGHEARALAMPETDSPQVEAWLRHLQAEIKDPNENTVLVGHSLGGKAVLQYLAALPVGMKVGQTILVASVLEKVTGLTAEEMAFGQPWFAPLDAAKVRRATADLAAFFSDNDELIPLESEILAREQLGARTIVLPGRGHFNESSGIFEVPEVLAEIVED